VYKKKEKCLYMVTSSFYYGRKNSLKFLTYEYNVGVCMYVRIWMKSNVYKKKNKNKRLDMIVVLCTVRKWRSVHKTV